MQRAARILLALVVLGLLAAGPAPAACPVTLTSGLCLPDDPAFASQWGMHNTGQAIQDKTDVRPDADVDAAEAWSVTTGSPDVVVAVVDTGIAYDNPDLAPRIWKNAGELGTDARGRDRRANGVDDDGNGYVDDWQGWDFVGRSVNDRTDADNDPDDLAGHGTHVAGIIGAAGDNARGATGIAWNVRLMNLRVRGERSNEKGEDVADAFDYAGDNGAQVVNASLAELDPSPRLRQAMADHPGVLYVIAAGNKSWDLDQQPGHPSYPCLYHLPNVVCVAATGVTDRLASFSSWGRTSVDLAAPGQITRSTQPRWTAAGATESFASDPFAGPRWSAGAAAGFAPTWGWSGGRIVNHRAGAVDEPGSDTWAEGGPFDLSGRKGCLLWASVDTNASPGAGLYVQARSDRAFQPASRQPAQDASTPTGDTVSFVGSAVTKALGVQVSELDGDPSVFVRFGVLAAGGVQRTPPRASVDNVRFECLGGTMTGDETGWMQGTSMATPLVAGIAALVKSAFPQENSAQLKDDLLRAVDPLPDLAGRVATGGRVNAYKAVARSTVAVRDGVLEVRAGDGERNHFTLTRPYTNRVLVEDAWTPLYASPMGGSRLMPGPGCGRLGDTRVLCTTEGVRAIAVDAGDLEDTISTVDGLTALVDCGPGADTLLFDPHDTQRTGCEEAAGRPDPRAPAAADPNPLPPVDPVLEPGPAPAPGPSPAPTPAPGSGGVGGTSSNGGPAPDTTRPTAAIEARNRRIRLSARGRLVFKLGPVSEDVTGTATFTSRRRLVGGRRVARFGTARFQARAGRRVSVAVTLSRADRRRVRRLRTVTTDVRFVLTDAAGNTRAVRYRFALRRP